jgi:alpha-tubulin suppressor-like RCC1 family protein
MTTSDGGGSGAGEVTRSDSMVEDPDDVDSDTDDARRWSSVSVGSRHACAIDVDGRLYCWGENDQGQLGLGVATPDHVFGLTQVVAGGQVWIQVTAGGEHTCALDEIGSLVCFGAGSDGQLGHGSEEGSPTPVAVVGPASWHEVTAMAAHTCGMAHDDTLWCWGRNDHAQVGVIDADRVLAPRSVGSGITWSSVAGGRAHTCAVRLDTRRSYCWGNPCDMKLGMHFQDCVPVAEPVPGVSDIEALASSPAGTYALRSGGDVYRWGAFKEAFGHVVVYPEPFPYDRGGWSGVAAGVGGHGHTCFLDEDAEIWCYGQNDLGQLGRASDRDGPIAAAGPWRAIAVGGDQSCAIRIDDDSLWCWGDLRIGPDADICPLDPASVDLTTPVSVCGQSDRR